MLIQYYYLIYSPWTILSIVLKTLCRAMCFSGFGIKPKGHTLHLLVMSLLSLLIWISSSAFLFVSWPWHFWRVQASLFYKMALNLGLSDISSRLDSVCAFCQDYHWSDIVSPVLLIKRYLQSICSNISDVGLMTWLMWC